MERCPIMVRHSFRVGLSFGLTSGIITTLGLMVGLHSGTHSRLVVIGGILTIALTDAFSDALGVHISEEAEDRHSSREVWEATASTFLFKFLSASTFLIPVLLFELSTAIVIGVIYGFLIILILSFNIAKEQRVKTWKVVFEHLIIVLMVIVLAHYIGDWLSSIFR